MKDEVILSDVQLTEFNALISKALMQLANLKNTSLSEIKKSFAYGVGGITIHSLASGDGKALNALVHSCAGADARTKKRRLREVQKRINAELRRRAKAKEKQRDYP